MDNDLLPVLGISLATTSAGIYKKKRNDVTLFQLNEGANMAAVFTKNNFAAAPVVIAKRHLRTKLQTRFLLVNAGNANAGLGKIGEDFAIRTCKAISDYSGCTVESALPFSTGVIGERFPYEKINSVIPELIENLGTGTWQESAKAIMTTDTVAKGISKTVTLSGKNITITGIAKGSGMIRPDMATMLAFIGTDAAVDPQTLELLLNEAVNSTFNRITVDGDTSTNDACVLVATGMAGNVMVDSTSNADYAVLKEGILKVCENLAKAIVKDGEGATKFIVINVKQGKNLQECLEVAYTIAHSPLIKTAFFASDPNWGRILAAIGRANIPDLNIDNINVYLDDVRIVTNGARCDEYTEEKGVAVMSKSEICLTVDLGRGQFEETVWTCDLSHDYVSINADYRS